MTQRMKITYGVTAMLCALCVDAWGQAAPYPPPSITCQLVDLNTDNVHIRVTWTDCVNETIYRIYRTQDETQLNDPAAWTLVASPASDTTSYDDYNVQPYDPVSNPKGTYYYKVIAYNASGNTESNNCNATMPAVNVPSGGSSGGSHSGGGGGGCFIDTSVPGVGGGWTVAGLVLALALILRRLIPVRR